MIKINYSKLREKDAEEIQNFANQISQIDKEIISGETGKEKSLNVFQIIDALAVRGGESYMTDFNYSFNKEMGIKKGNYVKFNLLSDEMIKAQYDVTVTGGTLAPTIGTDIADTVEAFVRNVNPFLSLVTFKKATQPKNSWQLWDFDVEQDAAALNEVATGTDVDDIPRAGDLLLARNKIQASEKISELAFSTMDGTEAGIFVARITRRVLFTLTNNILNGGSGAANGTARGGLIRGLLNNYGVNGTGDGTSTIGSIQYGTKALADAAIVAAGGVTSTDAYDLAVKVKRMLLPVNLSEAEENDFKFIMNRNTWGAISTVVDLNGRYKAHTSIDPTTGRAVKMIDDTEVIIVPSTGLIPNGFVHLIAPKLINIYTYGNIVNMNDGGIVQMREGLVTFVSRIWADASMRYGQKFRRTTAVTIGSTTPDNIDQNAYRYFRIT
jgi:HK97 family phage major capsid protein